MEVFWGEMIDAGDQVFLSATFWGRGKQSGAETSIGIGLGAEMGMRPWTEAGATLRDGRSCRKKRSCNRSDFISAGTPTPR